LLPPIRRFYLEKFGWTDSIFDTVDWDIFRPVYKKSIAKNGIQWIHKHCIRKLPTGARVHKRDHFHDKRCASCWHTLEDDDHIFSCTKRKAQRRNILKQINILRNTVDPVLCDILREGLMSYFLGECMTTTMLRIRGQEGMERYDLLIDEQLLIGRDNLLRGKFTKQWKIQQKTYLTRKRLSNPALYARKQRKKKRQEEKNKNKDTNKGKTKKTNKTEAFHSFFQSIIPFIKEIWKERCIDRNTPVIGGRIVAEYDALSKRVTQMYTMREMVLPEDELKIFDEILEIPLEATNQQLKKWLLRWRPVIDHSMKKVKELAQAKSKPIWRHFTAAEPAKTKVSRKVSTRQHKLPRKMLNNPLTNVFTRNKNSRSTSRPVPISRPITRPDNLINRMFATLGKHRSTSRVKPILDVEDQCIVDRYGDFPT
jgi:hypothetical protein